MDWTPSEMDELRALWSAGYSASEIARRLGSTKNSVVGKVHRMGLPARPSPIANGARGAQAAARREKLERAIALQREGYTAGQIGRELGINRETAGKMLRDAGHGTRGRRRAVLPVGAAVPRLAVVPPAPALPAPPAPRPLNRLRDGCRWPIGEPRKPGFRFCGAADVVPGKSYCAAHCAEAYDRTERHGPFLLKRIGAAA